MSEGPPPFKKDDERPKGKPEDEKFDAREALAEASSDTESSLVDTPHETHIPVERVGDFRKEALKEVPPAFQALMGIKDALPKDEEAVLPQNPVQKQEEKKSGGGFWDKVFVDPNATRAEKVSGDEKPVQADKHIEQDKETTPSRDADKKQPNTNPSPHRPVDGMRRVPKSFRGRAPTQKEGEGSGYAREQKEIGKIVGAELLTDIERAALERLKKLPNWDKYRFTGELTEEGFLIEKPEQDNSGNIKEDEKGNPVIPKPHVRPSEVVLAPQYEEVKEGITEVVQVDEQKESTENVPVSTEAEQPTPESSPLLKEAEQPVTEIPQPESPVPETIPAEDTQPVPDSDTFREEESLHADIPSEKSTEEEPSTELPLSEISTTTLEEMGVESDTLPSPEETVQAETVQQETASEAIPLETPHAEAPTESPEVATKQIHEEEVKNPENPPNTQEAKAGKKELSPEFKEARDNYIAYRNTLRTAEQELAEVINEYQLARRESGMFGMLFSDKELKARIEQKRKSYDDTVNTFLTERDSLISAHVATRPEGKGVTSEETDRYVAFLKSLTSRRVARGAEIVARVGLKTNEHGESTNRSIRFMQQSWNAYRKLPPHKKILYTTALAAGTGLVLGATGVAAGGAIGAGVAYGTRRFVGGTLGMGAAIGAKLGIDRFAEQREGKKLTEETEGVFKGKSLSEAVAGHADTKKQTTWIKRGGTAAAATAGIAVGASATGVVDQLQHGVDIQDVQLSKGLVDMSQRVQSAGRSVQSWLEGIKGGSEVTPGVATQAIEHAPLVREDVPATHVVEKGDTVWDILQEKLKAKGVFDGMNERQRTHIIDALKDEVVALAPKELEAMGIESGDPNLIKPGQTLDFSHILDKQSINEAVAGAPGVSVETIPDTTETHTTDVVQGDVPVEQPTTVPESRKPFTSQSHLNTEMQKSFSSTDHLYSENGTLETSAGRIEDAQGAHVASESAVDTGPRLKDFAGSRNLEQLAKDFPDYRGEKSLASFQGVWEKLEGQGKIDRHLLGRYPHLESGWGPLAHVSIRDLYDSHQGVQYNIDGKPIDLSPQAEAELRNVIELTRSLPGGDMLEMCVEKNYSVGDYMNIVATVEGLHAPEVSTPTTLDTASIHSAAMVEQTVQPMRVAATEEVPQQPARAVQEPSTRTKVDRPRYTKPIIGVGGRYTLGDPDSGFAVEVGGGARLGGRAPIHYARIHTNDPIDPEVVGEYKAKYTNARFLSKNPQVAEWSEKTAGELLETDPAFKEAWLAERRQIIDEAYRGHPVDLEPKDELKLQEMSGERALKELMDEEEALRDRNKYRVTVRKRII